MCSVWPPARSNSPAVASRVKRDHQAEWKLWESWLETISASVKRIDGVTTQIRQPSADLSNRSPSLSIQWDGARLGITGQEVNRTLMDTEPRVNLASSSKGLFW